MTNWDDLSEKEQLLTYISDVHKDAYGFRPRGLYNDLSVPELKLELDKLYEAASEEADRIHLMETQAWKALKSHYANLVDMGAKDFRQALAWDMEAEDVILVDAGHYVLVSNDVFSIGYKICVCF